MTHPQSFPQRKLLSLAKAPCIVKNELLIPSESYKLLPFKTHISLKTRNLTFYQSRWGRKDASGKIHLIMDETVDRPTIISLYAQQMLEEDNLSN